MKTRQVTEEDIPEIFAWFEARKWPLPPIVSIAPIYGFVAEDDNGLVACAWMYLTGRSIAFIEWTGTSPSVSDQLGTKGLHEVIEFIKEFSGKLNPPVKALCLYTQNEKLAEHFEKMKFKKTQSYYRCLWSSK